MSRLSWKQILGVVLLALLVGVTFLKKPGLGDDFTYWRLAFDIRDSETSTFKADNAHRVRWPVWGACWLLQETGVPGLVSYYAVPLVILAAGALLTFLLTRRVLKSDALGWMGAVAFLFHPLLDPVAYRPMPDLSEGIWGAGVVLGWLAAMRSTRMLHCIGWSLLTGFLWEVMVANRFTGVLMAPVLVILTLIFFPRRFGVLLMCIAAGVMFYTLEALIYWRVTGDFFANLHANLAQRGKKGTEAIPIWKFPFRFFDTLWKGSFLSPVYMILAMAGAWAVYRNRNEQRQTGLVIIAWAVVMYLGYSCAIQSIHPIRPMLRDAGRFLGALAIPIAVLVAAAIPQIGEWLKQVSWAPARRFRDWVTANQLKAGLIAILLTAALSSRTFFDMDFVPDFSRYIASRPPGTTVFTQRSVRAMAFLVNSTAAEKLDWKARRTTIIDNNEDLNEDAAASNEFWYIRKLAWLRTRQKVVSGQEHEMELAPYFGQPEKDWRLAHVFDIEVNPEIVIYQRRKPQDPPALELPSTDPAWEGHIPALPASWDGKNRDFSFELPVPGVLQGKRISIQTEADSNVFQPVAVILLFSNNSGKAIKTLELKPNTFEGTESDFVAFEVPAEAAKATIRFRIEKTVKRLRLSRLRVLAD